MSKNPTNFTLPFTDDVTWTGRKTTARKKACAENTKNPGPESKGNPYLLGATWS